MPVMTNVATDVRYVGRIPGRYTLPDRKAQSGISVFACRTQGITPNSATVSAPVSGQVGDLVTANFDDIGIVHGKVSRLIQDGFAMDIDPDTNDCEKLASRIDWIKKKVANGVADSRDHKRVIPRYPHSTLVLSDGKKMKCFIINMSASGAAVSADCSPPLGTPLAIGKVVCRVVRHLEVGFAVKFVKKYSLDEIESLLVKRPKPAKSPT